MTDPLMVFGELLEEWGYTDVSSFVIKGDWQTMELSVTVTQDVGIFKGELVRKSLQGKLKLVEDK